MRQKYIIQIWNNKKLHWFDYITFYNRDNSRRVYQRLIKCSEPNIKFRLLEVISYDFKEY